MRHRFQDRGTVITGILLLLITLLALGLRLFGLDSQSLWYDEAFSVYLARMGLAEITARTAADIQPPLYYYLLHGWIQLVGDSERGLRGLSLLFGVLTVPLMYAAAWQLFSRLPATQRRLAGLLAALLVAISPLHVWYGQEARMYTLLTFLCLLSSYLLLLVIPRSIRGQNRWATLALWAAYTLVNIAALYTHYFAVFCLGFQALYLFLVWWEAGLRPARLILGGLASLLVTALAFLPWLPNLITRYGADASYWPGRLKFVEVLLDIVVSFIGGESVFEATGTMLAIGYGLVLLLCMAALVAQAVRVWLRKGRLEAHGPELEAYGLQALEPEAGPGSELEPASASTPAEWEVDVEEGSESQAEAEETAPEQVVGEAQLLAEGETGGSPRTRGRFFELQRSSFNLRPQPFDYQPPAFDYRPPRAPSFDPPVSTFQYPLAFLLLYLFITPALILLLSYNAPKFNPRYAMVAQPALALIVAGGLATLWQKRDGRLGNWIRWILAGLALAYVLGVSAYATYNIYTNPAFSRADFRGVARYIGRHIAPDDTIILTSGHMFPAFDYYAPGAERHLLPDSPTLDATRTLDYTIASDLMAWLAGKGGVWVVRWQDEVVDPVGYLATALDEVGEEQQVKRSFSQVGLEYYRLPAGATFSSGPAIDHPADYNFGDRLRLLGYSQTGDRQVTLFWQALQPLDQDYRVSLVLRDTEGQKWGEWDGRPSSYDFPTGRWPEGQIVQGRYDLAPVPGTPPGDYGLEVGVYTEADPTGLDVLDQAGAPQGKRAVPGGVKLVPLPASAEDVEAPHAGRADLGGGLELLGWDLDRDSAQPGDRLRLTLVWSVEVQPWDDYQVQVLVTGPAGDTTSAGVFPLTTAGHPTSGWQEGQAWRGQSTFRLPIQTQPGDAGLGIQLLGPGGEELGPPVPLASVEVLDTGRVFARPEPQVVQPAVLDGKAALVGADLAPSPAQVGEPLGVVLYWQALAEMDVPYTVFVHLLGPDGRLVAGHDSEPAGGARPTTGWVPGEYVADAHELAIPAGLDPGEYAIEVGMYDAGLQSLPRLPVLDDGGQAVSDHVILGTIQVR
jgi:hypothetical protein